MIGARRVKLLEYFQPGLSDAANPKLDGGSIIT
jgi:hypothetical protein